MIKMIIQEGSNGISVLIRLLFPEVTMAFQIRFGEWLLLIIIYLWMELFLRACLCSVYILYKILYLECLVL